MRFLLLIGLVIVASLLKPDSATGNSLDCSLVLDGDHDRFSPNFYSIFVNLQPQEVVAVRITLDLQTDSESEEIFGSLLTGEEREESHRNNHSKIQSLVVPQIKTSVKGMDPINVQIVPRGIHVYVKTTKRNVLKISTLPFVFEIGEDFDAEEHWTAEGFKCAEWEKRAFEVFESKLNSSAKGNF